MKKKCLSLLLAVAMLLSQGTAMAAGEEETYIVKLRDDAPMVLDAEGDSALGFGMYTVTKSRAEALMDAGLAEFMEPDGEVVLFDVPDDPFYSGQWYHTALNMTTAWSVNGEGAVEGLDGTGIKIGVVDSGLIPNHVDLDYQNTILEGYDVTVENVVNRDTTDELSHGTMVTGLLAATPNNSLGIAGLVPGATVLPIKCFVGRTTKVSILVRGIRKAVEENCDIINLSCGATSDSTKKAMMTATQAAVDEGIIVVAAVGNSGSAVLNYPAAYDHVIGVGAVDSDGVVASYSQKNASVYVTAPGSVMYSLSHSNTTGYLSSSGTSFAAPCVTALAAIALQKDPDITPAEFAKLLELTAQDDSAGDGYDYSYGHGTVNAADLLAGMEPCTITYEPNGGDTIDPVEYYTYKDVTLSTPTPTRAGYTFLGWYEDSALTGTPVTELDLTLGGDRTYYAKWLSNALKLNGIAFDGYAGEEDASGAGYTIYVPSGVELPTDASQFTFTKGAETANVTLTTEDAATGLWTITVTAGGDTRSYTLTVDNRTYAKPEPTQATRTNANSITPASLDGKVAAVGYAASVNDWFIDRDGDDMTYSIGKDTVGLTLSGTDLTFIPSAADAGQEVEFTVLASDGRFTGDPVTVTLTVGALPYSAPVLASTSATFQAVEGAEGVTVGMNLYGATLASIRDADGTALEEGTAYLLDEGQVVDPNDPEAAALDGSDANKVTFQPDWLATLSGGEHVLTFHFDTNVADPAEETVQFTLTVEKPVTGLALTSSQLTVGETLTLNATVTPADATHQTITWAVTDGGETGAVYDPTLNTLTATASGTVTLTATISDGSLTGDFTKSFTITVNAAGGSGESGGSGGGSGGGTSGGDSSGGSGGGGGGGGSPSVPEEVAPEVTESELTVTGEGEALLELEKDEALTEGQAKAVIEANGENDVVITNGALTVTIPAGTLSEGADVAALLPDVSGATGAPGQVVAYTDANGELHILPLSVVGEGTATFTVMGEGRYRIIDNTIPFVDIEEHWGEDAVVFVAARGLLRGVGEGRFAPELETSWATVFTLLARLAGEYREPEAGKLWYAPALDWAVANGISDGGDPEGAVSREQLAALLWRYAGRPTGGSLAGFNDRNEVSGWAVQAMGWAVEQGIITGKPGQYLDPAAGATRAEVAAIFQRFILCLSALEGET